MRRLLLLGVGGLLALAACSGGEKGGGPPVAPPTTGQVARLEVRPATLQLLRGATASLTVVATSATGDALPTPAVTWSSADAAIASVSSAGVVTGASAGSTTITARAGTLTATSAVSVRSPPTYDVIVSSDSGVTGTPAPGTLTVDSGATVIYSYRVRAGFQSLVVQRDTQRVAAEGSLVITGRTFLIATSAPAVTLSPAAEGLVAMTRAVLAAADPIAALEQLTGAYRPFLGAGDTARALELERLQREAFREVSPAALDSFYRRLTLRAATGRVRLRAAATGDAGAASASAAARGPIVLYVNGILNSPTAAAATVADIGAIASTYGYPAEGLYNPTWYRETGVSFLNCLLRVADPRQWSSGSLSLLQCIPVLPDLAEAQAQIDLVLAGASGTHPFVTTVRDRIVSELDAGRGVVFVAHSQGNLMLSEALRQLQLTLPSSAIPTASRCISVLSIASPLSDGWPTSFGVGGVIVAGTSVRDIMLTYPARNNLPPTATGWTLAGDLLYPLLHPKWPVLTVMGTGIGLHLMSTYLTSTATRNWIDQRVAREGQRQSTQCTDTLSPSVTTLSVQAGSSSPAITASRTTPTGKTVAGATFTWTSSNTAVARVVISPAVQVIGVAPGTARIDVTSGSAVESIQVQVTAAPPVTATLTAQPATIAPGSAATLSWSSTNATTCSAPWTTSVAASGTQQVNPTVSTTYQITCNGVGGSATASATITVSAPPTGGGSVVSISAGGHHTCVVASDGTARCWGDNLLGALGQDFLSVPESRVPVVVRGGTRFALIAAGFLATCAIDLSGRPWCWGYNARAAFGNPPSWSDTPVQVPQAPSLTFITRGYGFACGIDGSNDIHCWGALNGTAMSPLPGRVASADKFQVVRGGFIVACAIDTMQRAACWGDNAWGGFGNGGQYTSSAFPIAVAGNQRWLSVAPGTTHTCGVATTGDAFCWGMQTRSQLGLGTTTPTTVLIPTPVVGGIRFTQLVAGDYHTCALTAEGDAYCWGENTNGQLGTGASGDRAVPTAVAGGVRFRVLSAGASHTCGIDLADGVWCWGANDRGQLGDGGASNAIAPRRVAMP